MEFHEYPFVLRERLTNAGANALAEVLTAERDDVVTLVSTPFEQRLAEECGKLQSEISALGKQLRAEMQQLRVELKADFQVAVANCRADLVKWTFVFWIGQAAAFIGFWSVID